MERLFLNTEGSTIVDPDELCGGKDQVMLSDAVFKPKFDECNKLEADYLKAKASKPPITICPECEWKSGGQYGLNQHLPACMNFPSKPLSQAESMSMSIQKTQKARGIEKLNKFAFRVDAKVLPHLFVSNAQVKLIATNKLSDKAIGKLYQNGELISSKGKIFARCCPLAPRHGFIDSKFIKIGEGWAEFMTQLEPLCAQMLQDDPEAELVLMQPCFAHFNIVTNEKAVVVGKGHDGATRGKDTLTFPVSKPFEFSLSEKAEIGVSDESGVFSEYVGRVQKGKRYGEGAYDAAGAAASGGIKVTQTYLTQLRGGPKIDVTGDYVPREIALDRKYLIPHKNSETGEDYKDTEWEKVINDVKSKENWERYFVYHLGGSIASHFGVHCYINGIPYITSGVRLNKRTILKPNATVRKANLEAFKSGFQKGPNLLHLITPAKGVEILLACLHNFPAMDASDPKQAEVLGMAVEFAIHLGLSTCLGESRYAKRERMDCFKALTQGSRELVYYRAQMFDLNYVLRKAHLRCPWFGIPNWSGSVGGLKWLECSEAVFQLWNAVCLLASGGKDLSLVISQLNKVVNICHNAAKMLTKFTGSITFDYAAQWPNKMAFRITPILFELLKADAGEKSIQFEQFDLPKEKWDADLIRARRGEASRKLDIDKTPHGKCPECTLWVDLKPYHTSICSIQGKGVLPFKPIANIEPVTGHDQCQTCGWYSKKDQKPLGHYSMCPESFKNAASSAPSSYETDDNASDGGSKCTDESCSSCHPQQVGKE